MYGRCALPGAHHHLSVTGSPTWEHFCIQSTICSSETMQLCHVPALRLNNAMHAAWSWLALTMHCTLQGRNGAISVIALAERGALFDPGPCMYMEKLAGVACPHIMCKSRGDVPVAVLAVAWVLRAEHLRMRCSWARGQSSHGVPAVSCGAQLEGCGGCAQQACLVSGPPPFELHPAMHDAIAGMLQRFSPAEYTTQE